MTAKKISVSNYDESEESDTSEEIVIMLEPIILNNNCYFKLSDVVSELDLTYNDFFYESNPERTKDYVCRSGECTYKNRDNILITREGVFKLAPEEKIYAIKRWVNKVCNTSHKQILGITMPILDEITQVMTYPISCIYLVKLCSVKEFKKHNKGYDFDDHSEKISSNTPIYKYGGTKDLYKELLIDAKRYGDIRIIKYMPVHKKYIEEAERDVKRDCIDSQMKISMSRTDTHLVIPYDKLTDICCTYDAINLKFKSKTSKAIDTYGDAWESSGGTIKSLRNENKKLIEKLNKINKVSMC